MKYFLFILMIFICLCPPLPAQQQQKKIIEKVSVNWWQVPLFAVDEAGHAVRDLKAEEIRLTVNQKPVTSFSFIRHQWTLPGESGAVSKESDEISLRVEPLPGIPHAKPQVFLLFDLALTGGQSVRRAKAVAREIIRKSEAGTQFVIMTIEPFAGLTFLSRGNKERDKQNLLEVIDKKVIIRNNSRVVPGGTQGTVNVGNRTQGRDGVMEVRDREGTFLKMQAARFYRRKCTIFFRAFQTLFFHLNGISESKVVYLFSEGISTSVLSSLRGGRTDYNAGMQRVAAYLNQSGAVLFLINTMGVEQYASDLVSRQHEGGEIGLDSARSGDSSLHYMATESGGNYLKGTKTRIVSQLENIHRAFYEIAFPDTTKVQGKAREISVTCSRKGVSITTIRALDKEKPYKKMSKMGKEVLATNLVSGNPLIESRVTYSQADIKKTTYKNNLLTYYVTLPAEFMGKTLDLFNIRLGNEGGQRIIRKVKRSRKYEKSAELKISFYLNEGQKKQDACFVLVEPVSGKILLHRESSN